MAIFLAALVVAVLVLLALTAVLVRRRRSEPVGRADGQLARRVEDAPGGAGVPRDAYVDEQAAIWDAISDGGSSRRPTLFADDVDRPDPRTPEAYDVSDLYAPSDTEAGATADDGAFADSVDDLATGPADWEHDLDEERDADRAFVADLDDVPTHDRFAPRSPSASSAAGDDRFVSELLGGAEIDDSSGDEDPAPADPLERRTSKAGAETYNQPLRLARTQQRPRGGTRRSPEQIRSLLLNYRGGIRKGREGSQGDPPETAP